MKVTIATAARRAFIEEIKGRLQAQGHFRRSQRVSGEYQEISGYFQEASRGFMWYHEVSEHLRESKEFQGAPRGLRDASESQRRFKGSHMVSQGFLKVTNSIPGGPESLSGVSAGLRGIPEGVKDSLRCLKRFPEGLGVSGAF